MTAKLSKKPTYPGCKQGPTGRGHSRGEPWMCRYCGKKACQACVHHFWVSKAGHIEPRTSGDWVFVGERVGTCPSCSQSVVHGKKPMQRNPLLSKPPTAAHRLTNTTRFRRLFGRPPRESDYEGVHTTGSRLIAGAYAMGTWDNGDGYPVIVTLDIGGLKPLPDVDAMLRGAEAVDDLLSQYRDQVEAGETFYGLLNDDDFAQSEVNVGEEPAAFIFEDVGTHVLKAIDEEQDPEAVFEAFLKSGKLPDSVLTRMVDQQRYLNDFDIDRVVRVEALRPWWHQVLFGPDDEEDDAKIAALEARGYTVFTLADWPFQDPGQTKTLWEAPDANERKDVEYHGTTSLVIELAFPGLIPEESPFPISDEPSDEEE